MDGVIPRPDRHGPAAPGQGPHATGPWRTETADDRLTATARTVGTLLGPLLDAGPPTGAATAVLSLVLDDTLPPHTATVGVAPCGAAGPTDESYRLTVTEGGITCRAATPAGVFRAATTALQMIATSTGPLPLQEVHDAPRFAWRGLLIDPARHHLAPGEVRRLIDLAALYKLNVLHLHLTDNEGWRLQLPGTPELTPAAPDGGPRAHYTPQEYRALQRYAAERFVTVVPEIDLPGHCATLRAAFPGLPDAPAPEGLEGRFPYVPPLDLTDPRTRETVARIIADVCRATDGPFVHIGGDEAVGATADSFAHSVRELRALVRACGKRPLGWQESSRAGIGPDDIAQFWVDVPMMDLPDTAGELAARPELLAAGHTPELVSALKRFFAPSDQDLARIVEGGGRVLLSPQSHLYLDRAYATDVVPPHQAPDAARLGFPAYRPLGVRHCAAWDPASHAVPDDRIAGVEATVFGESVEGFDDVSLLLLPRLPGVAEAAWNGRAPRWEDHRVRLARHARLWRRHGFPHLATTEVPWDTAPEETTGRRCEAP